LYVLSESGCTKNNEWATVQQKSCADMKFLCSNDDVLPSTSSEANSALGKANIAIHNPSGASSKCFAHYGQIIHGGDGNTPIFQPFDFGIMGNLEKYGRKSPPQWDLKQLTVPLSLLEGEKDGLGTAKNTAELARQLNVGFTRDVMPGYQHSTFLEALDPQPMFDVIDREIALDQMRETEKIAFTN